MKLSSKGKQIPWHPDFRIAEGLPDTKVVRTEFLINLVVGVIAGVLLIVVGYREAQSFNLQRSIRYLEQERDSLQSENLRVLRLNREFTQSRRIYDDLTRFFDAPFAVDRLIHDLALLKPDDIALSDLNYLVSEQEVDREVRRRHQINLSAQTRSLAAVEEIKNRIAGLEYLADRDPRISESGSTRIGADTWTFSLRVEFDVEKPE